MAPRLDLEQLLRTLLGSDNVYFQPPENIQMVYPCIVYNRDAMDTKFADDGPYLRTRRYQVTVIDRNPDSETLDKIANLPLCSFSQHFVADNLNHDVFSLFF